MVCCCCSCICWGLRSASALPLRNWRWRVFLEYKCNKCHTVSAAKVERSEKEPEGDRPAPDLSSVGSRRSRAWIEAFLQKRETIDGRRHKPQFRGDDEELAALLDWLGSLTATNGAVKK